MSKKYTTDNITISEALNDGSGVGTSGQVLSSTGSGVSWIDGSGIVGGPYLPLTGGTLTGDLKLNDNVDLYLGTGNDLQIYHDGSNSYIQDTGTGNLLITSNGASVQINKGTTENMAEFITDGAVKLYYDSAKKFETTSAGVTVTGDVISNAIVQANGFRTTSGSTDYSLLTRNSSNTAVYIQQAGSGDILDVRYGSQAAGQGTSAFAVNSSGNATFAGTITSEDITSGNIRINEASNPNLQLYRSDVTTQLWELSIDSSGRLLFQEAASSGGTQYTRFQIDDTGEATFSGSVSAEDNIYLTDAGTVRAKLLLNASDRDNVELRAESLGSTMKFFTAGTEALELDASQNATFAGDVSLANLKSIYLGTSSALRIYTDSATAYLRGDDVRLTNAANDSIVRVNGDVAELYYNDLKKFETTSTGVTVTGKVSGVTAGTANTDAVNLQQLNNATTGVLVYQGVWNASTNTPTLASATGTPGYYYIVDTDGSTNLDGITDWKVGDWAVFSDMATDAWQKIDNTSILGGAGTGGTVALWSGSGTSLTLSDAPITASGGNTTITGKLGVGSVNAGFDFYNNGTSYFNGAVTIDSDITQTGATIASFTNKVGVGTVNPYAFDTTETKFHVQNAGTAGSVVEVARFEGSSDADGSGATVRISTSNDKVCTFKQVERAQYLTVKLVLLNIMVSKL